jgi:uncharacterized damage-inducible protein DinB
MSERKELDRIINLFNMSFHGGAWHGPSFLENIKDITPKTAGNRQTGTHTIAELVYHTTSWRIFAVKKIQGEIDYNVSTEKQNWGNLKEIDEFEWETLQMELTLSQDELIMALTEKDDEFLDQIVSGSEYNFHTLLHGIIQHDIYHSGQVAILKKGAVKKTRFSDDDDYGYKTSSFLDDEY